MDTSFLQGKKALYYTLGCKLNFSETSTFSKILQGKWSGAGKEG
jgi:threonylcarbamoyladenosine tRNA methylthiotransferase MtaB